ncbi:MAG: phospholipase C, phosphocholine-specific, partial [Mycobacteriaceae bacterium]|nr:phospholipase C, phosphocholine-specific [Mycobacteriaceae bacterium]
MVESLAAPAVRGKLFDVKHVVVLMQENRSFDHYYGTMSGVRGFGDRTAVTLPNGQDVFRQPVFGGGLRMPYWINTALVAGQDNASLDLEWGTQHQAMANGRYDGWVGAKTEAAMGYFRRSDIPFHRALADAFTICDAYHCSVLGPTTPNRLYMFTGTIDPNGRAGGPVVHNPPDYRPALRWRTYPEFLSERGVSWKVYANDEVGNDTDGHPYLGDYGDNPLWLFGAYHADCNSDLSKCAGVTRGWKPASAAGRGNGHNPEHALADFISDCASGRLPEVSWLVAPYGYCEHPQARPDDGAAYIRTMLTALWDNQDLWNSTVVLINYDENDGLFDHVPPPLPPPGTPDEFVRGLPIGLGYRVPMTVISPWSRGGAVASELFDHTSVIRFIESWKHPDQPFPNISAWRRAVCGDLTSCFNFAAGRDARAEVPKSLRAMSPYPANREQRLPASTPPPLDRQSAPTQDKGRRPARPLPYQPVAPARLAADGRAFALPLRNSGARA